MKHILQIYILLHLTFHRLGDNILQNILMVNKKYNRTKPEYLSLLYLIID